MFVVFLCFSDLFRLASRALVNALSGGNAANQLRELQLLLERDTLSADFGPQREWSGASKADFLECAEMYGKIIISGEARSAFLFAALKPE